VLDVSPALLVELDVAAWNIILKADSLLLPPA
jgi:hypothetical protein